MLSSLAVLVLVFTVIEAPEYGWLAARTLIGFAAAVALLVAFVAYETRVESPLLDVRLFRNARFSAAALAITFSFFALFGFIFLITQYFQVLRGYGPFETGLRLLPVALSTGAAAVIGTLLAVRIGNKVVVATGLGLAAVMFAWTSQADDATPYLEIVGQMVMLGVGMGFTAAPATESIMGAVPEANAGVGSGSSAPRASSGVRSGSRWSARCSHRCTRGPSTTRRPRSRPGRVGLGRTGVRRRGADRGRAR